MMEDTRKWHAVNYLRNFIFIMTGITDEGDIVYQTMARNLEG